MRTVLAALSVVVVLLSAGGCTTTVFPPPRTHGPTATLYITNYGRHSSLLLPISQTEYAPTTTVVATTTTPSATTSVADPSVNPRVVYVEYTIGDWAWFATGDTRWWV